MREKELLLLSLCLFNGVLHQSMCPRHQVILVLHISSQRYYLGLLKKGIIYMVGIDYVECESKIHLLLISISISF